MQHKQFQEMLSHHRGRHHGSCSVRSGSGDADICNDYSDFRFELRTRRFRLHSVVSSDRP